MKLKSLLALKYCTFSFSPKKMTHLIVRRRYVIQLINANRYLASGKKVLCIGVTFDPKTRNIGEWAVKP